MAGKVNLFLSESGGNNFTETAPRPPVPGEENELQSNGGRSTQSSGSHKSQTSNKSHTSTRSMGSTKGDNRSPGVTPRKSTKLDKTVTSLSGSIPNLDDDDAPLGFEPEGSAANSPPFTENSTPPYMKWAESLNYLLEDRDGVQLFRSFLEQEGIGSYCLDFWFACRGLKIKDPEDSLTINNVVRVIHKKYIKSDKLPCVSRDTRQVIGDALQRRTDSSYQGIFDEAQKEVENDMRNNTYPLFIKSDLYVQYISRCGESPKSSNSSSGSNSARPLSSAPLPPLIEDQEYIVDSSSISLDGPPPSKSFARTHSESGAKKQESFSVPLPMPVRPSSHPYTHVSYAPVSAQDSEIQSLSSQDNLTDDTRSLTDSSVDGFSHHDNRKWRKHHKAMQKRARQNMESANYHQHFIPRTERAPKDRNIAEVDPPRFAALLIQMLEKVVREREKEERLQETINKAMSDVPEEAEKSFVSTTTRNNTTATSMLPLMTSSMIEEENADSILEEHCSRIWESSAQHSPTHSPGRSKSPDRAMRKVLSQTQPSSHSGSSSMPGTLQSKSLHSRKKTDLVRSTLSFDSGMGEENPAVETHKHIHHHHHHHHSSGSKTKSQMEIQAQKHSMTYYYHDYVDGIPRTHDYDTSRGRTARKQTNRKSSDSGSNIDSGISIIESIPPQAPNIADPSTSKVLQWMMDNENRGASSAYPDSDKSSSQHKRPHKGTLPTSATQPYKQSSTSKKTSNHGHRSSSADSSTRGQMWPAGVGGATGVMPYQPFVTDPSMPLLPPPNTTVQLEEVNRRLEADQTKVGPVKSKSFPGVPSKEKRSSVPSSQSTSQVRTSSSTAGKADLDNSGDSSHNTSGEKRTGKKSSGSGNTSTSSKPEETVIGYYFCGEPIPYRSTVPGTNVTLGQFKHLISKRGNYRYFFKTYSRGLEFDSEVVFEEIRDENAVLPLWEGKVVAKVEKLE